MTKPKAKRPETVYVSPFTVKVDVDPTLTEKHGLLGHWSGDSQRITLDGNMADVTEIDTLLHELLHALWSQTPLDKDYDAELEEKVIWTLTPRLLAMLRDNPDMVQWVMTCGK